MKKLKDDVKEIFTNLFGPEVAKQADMFEKPDMYPKDFLEQSMYFLAKFIGEDAAKKKLEPLYKKYVIEGAAARQKPSKGRKMRTVHASSITRK